MTRPSIKSERREQILDACERCIVRFGVEGATLERIAEASGLARPLIRHNIGNREDLMAALVERFLKRSKASLESMFGALPKQNGLDTLVTWLFDPEYWDTHLMLLSEALIAASANNPDLAEKMRTWTMDFVDAVADIIRREYPNATEETVLAVAVGITAIYANAESLTPLGRMTQLVQASKNAAFLLLKTLQT